MTAISVGGFLFLWPVCFSLAQNNPASNLPPTPAPAFSLASGVYTNNLFVRITTTSPGSVIRFTTDGSDPGARSSVYSAPFLISNSVLVKAQSFGPALSPSPIVSRTFTFAEADLANFDSNLPLVILSTFGQEVPHETKVPISARFIDPRNGRSSLAGSADFDGRALLNVRGRTSLRYPKHSYHLKTRDDAGGALKISLLGFPKESDWVLYAPYPDKTLMRDFLAYELSNKIGRYAPGAKFVEVFVNESGGKLSWEHYAGVYVLEEKIKRGKNRVNIEKLAPGNNSEPEISGGYIFKKDHTDRVILGPANMGGFPNQGGSSSLRPGFPTGPGGFPASHSGFLPSEDGPDGAQLFREVNPTFPDQRLPNREPGQIHLRPIPGQPIDSAPVIRERVQVNSDRGPGRFDFLSPFREAMSSRPELFSTRRRSQFFYVEPKADEITSAQKKWLTGYLNRFEDVLYGPNFRDPANGYAAYLDVDSFIDHHLLVEVTKNIDGFRFSTFYHKDRGGKLKLGPLWDWNLSMGNANGKQGWMPEYWYWPQLDDQQYSWYRRLFEDPDFGQRYVDRWGQLRTNILASSTLLARIDELAKLLREPQRRNFERWPILGRQVWPNYFVGRTYQAEVQWMKQWMSTRLAWINGQFLPSPDFSVKESSVARGTRLSMETPVGKILYTVDGTDPRASGGGLSTKAQLYSTPLTLSDNVRIFARVSDDGRWSSPSIARFEVSDAATRKSE